MLWKRMQGTWMSRRPFSRSGQRPVAKEKNAASAPQDNRPAGAWMALSLEP